MEGVKYSNFVPVPRRQRCLTGRCGTCSRNCGRNTLALEVIRLERKMCCWLWDPCESSVWSEIV
jgi:hypothetical protein